MSEEDSFVPTLEIPENRITLVEFPGRVKNVDKAMKMIGSASSVEKIVTGESKYLELRYRPEDSSCHPLFGDNFQTNNLVIKVKKTKGKLNYEILGVANNTIRFKGMSDYQYLESSNQAENELNLPPPLFSRHDQPYDYKFKENPGSTTVEVVNPDGSVRIQKKIKRVHKKYTFTTVTYESKNVPEEPPKEWKIPKSSKILESIVKDLFEIRPIWTMKAMKAQMKSKEEIDKVKNILPGFGYYMSTGPWRTTWIKYGIDPRSNSQYAKYQIIDFRIPSEIRENMQIEKEQAPTKPIRTQKLDINTVENFLHRTPAQTEFHFIFDSIPDKLQSYYQLCDIGLKSAQKIIHKPSTSCTTKQQGFYTKTQITSIRQILKDKVTEWVDDIIEVSNDKDLIEVKRDYRKDVYVDQKENETTMQTREEEEEEEDEIEEFSTTDEEEDFMVEEDVD
eukprot:gene12188-5775_t